MSVRSAPGPGGPAVDSEAARGAAGDRHSGVSGTVAGDGDALSLGASSTTSGSDEDEFSRLKATREQERRQRMVARLARSVSAQGGAGDALASDTEQLLMGLLPSGRVVSPRSSLFGDAHV